ncbi:MAG: hypothetical protein P8M30_16700 [Planctomycetaceae bacterium]|nr:hypothetical protein [Planctomycetaceae bacterium]MDB4786690.1 hypothetical protein [Planctomycetaceae bacterium]MDC0273144.1 hypothetical protein [Planctomycetaceae bacterium]MDG2390948.1 hypothetical protein [Planctomycetaceae bacterium]
MLASNSFADEHEGYKTRDILGWNVHVSEELLKEMPEKTKVAMKLFEEQLQKVVDRVPSQIVKKLQTVPIWFSPQYPNKGPSGEYHPGKQWLIDNDRRPELVHCVEFTNVSIFPKEVKRMPMVALHELAHAYHHLHLTYDHPGILAAFKDAKETGKYQKVKRNDGKEVTAYAITNDKEYFAELSEAYFGINDFYPFRKQELQDYDPLMYRVLTQVWEMEKAEQ